MSDVDIDFAVPIPNKDRDGSKKGRDVREHFSDITKKVPRDHEAESAFIASKIRMAVNHPALDDTTRARALVDLGERLERLPDVLLKETPPAPGGVGYGVFYNAAFRSAFAQGTSVNFQVVCPTIPGGNVNTWLYLTAMNRAGRGIEAFVSYNAQTSFHFKVFDWARNDHWQIDCPFDALGNYLTNVGAHGQTYQTLNVWNSTYQVSATTWRNEALLWNRVANRWDLIYRYDYAGTSGEQTSGWVGSWGPIVETFQDTYTGTRPVGALGTQIISRNSSGTWGVWGLVGTGSSSIRNDGHGFSLVFLDPNYAFVVKS